MIDGFGRRITYVRMSVTDRCDLRCRYCMAETMTFLPRKDVLTLEELVELADIFIAREPKHFQLCAIGPKNNSIRTNPMHGLTCILNEIAELLGAACCVQ